MINIKRKNLYVFSTFAAIFTVLLFSFYGCAKGPEWKSVNDQLIKQYNIQTRELGYDTETGVLSNLQDGVVSNLSNLPDVEIAPGVIGKMYWDKGNLVCLVTMEPNAEISTETLSSERIMIMQEGSVEQLVNGTLQAMQYTPMQYMYYYATGDLGSRDCLYLEEGTDNSVKAGPNGAKFVEFYYPPRLDYIQKAGGQAPATVNAPVPNATPNVPANQIFNLFDIQRTEISVGAWSQLINGKGMQVSVLFMAPGMTFGQHNHPEEQLMVQLRANTNEIILDGTKMMDEGAVLYLPSQMVHGGIIGDTGSDVIDVFYPVRSDYLDKYEAQLDAYHSIIPRGEKPVLLGEGFKFTEGPVWINDTYYFSSMYFDIPAGTWAPDGSKSDLIAMKPDGTWKYVLQGKTMTNGLMAMGNGNIAACNMSGHKIQEITTTGRVVRDLVTNMEDGVRLDGPNDLCIDAKGGIYFTDPQFIGDAKMRPGGTVNYRKPDGTSIELIHAGEYGMANALLLSPDGKTAYVNNTYDDGNHPSDADNYIWAYDVNDDGTLSNKRAFFPLFLHSTEYAGGSRSSCADGMTMDVNGNLYVGTNVGLQIISPEGKFIGNLHVPTFPVSVCFGGENYDTLFMTCWDKIYTMKTNTKGLVYPLK